MKLDGPKFEAARLAAGVTRSAIAETIGQTHARVWQLSTEAVSNINPAIGKLIANKLKVKPEDITA